MAITIKKVSTKRELKKFIRFNYRMYRCNFEFTTQSTIFFLFVMLYNL